MYSINGAVDELVTFKNNSLFHTACNCANEVMPLSVFCFRRFGEPLTIGARRHGQGALPSLPRKCCKVFCALAVTVDQLYMHYFHNFFFWGGERRSGLFSSFDLCFEGRRPVHQLF